MLAVFGILWLFGLVSADFYLKNPLYRPLHGAPKDPNTFLIFDLDNTLYSCHDSFSQRYSSVTLDFIKEHLNVTASEASEKIKKYYAEFGNPIRGMLLKGELLDYRDYERYVDEHSDYRLMKPIKGLRELLKSSSATLVILSNSGKRHTQRALRQLHLEDLFEYLFFADFSRPGQWISKPDVKSYKRVEQIVESQGRLSPKDTSYYFVDDLKRNVRGAQKADWTTLWLNEGCKGPSQSTSNKETIKSIHEVQHIWPHLFKQTTKGQ